MCTEKHVCRRILRELSPLGRHRIQFIREEVRGLFNPSVCIFEVRFLTAPSPDSGLIYLGKVSFPASRLPCREGAGDVLGDDRWLPFGLFNVDVVPLGDGDLDVEKGILMEPLGGFSKFSGREGEGVLELAVRSADVVCCAKL